MQAPNRIRRALRKDLTKGVSTYVSQAVKSYLSGITSSLRGCFTVQKVHTDTTFCRRVFHRIKTRSTNIQIVSSAIATNNDIISPTTHYGVISITTN